MKNFVLSNIVFLLPLSLLADNGACQSEEKRDERVIPNHSYTAIKDDFSDVQPSEKTAHEHRINFGLLNLGYERILPDSFYVGADVKFTPIYSLDKDKQNSFDHFINGELRFGYNHSITKKDTFVPYFGVGFSVFKFEKKEGNLKDWNYATLGLKGFHKFGEIFEMGLHIKGYRSIQEKKTTVIKKKKKNPDIIIINRVPKMQDNQGNPLVVIDGKLQPEKLNNAPIAQPIGNPKEIIEEKLDTQTISFKDASWMMEIGVPLIWHIGSEKNWEIQVEPYYLQIPNGKRLHLLGSRLSFGFRF